MIRPRTAVLILIVLYLIVGTIDHVAARTTWFLLLENSSRPATLGECQRRHPSMGRPQATISYQQRSGEPWHHRTCAWSG